MKSSGSSQASALVAYASLVLLALLFFVPFYWMLIQSTHTSSEILAVPPPLLPGTAFGANYGALLHVIDFWRSFANSLFVSSTSTALSLLFCSMGGFAFAMYEFPGKRALFGVLLVTMMIPWIVSIIPWFVVMSRLGWVNRFQALIVPGSVSAFGIFWMRQYISAHAPAELLDAARIDGCAEALIFFRIFAPILTPAFGALGILTFLNNWNSFFYPLIVLQTREMLTVPLALRYLSSDPYRGMDFGVLMNGTVMAVAPVMIVFWSASKRFIAGLTSGALKG
jgi:ABC-type glycerol-3-phosphate transport system permease component